MMEERTFCKGSRDYKIQKELTKIWYLLAFSPHCPYHKNLEVVKVKVAKLEYMLDKV